MESEFLLVWVPTALLHLAYPQPLFLLLKARCTVLGCIIKGAGCTMVITYTKAGREGGGKRCRWRLAVAPKPPLLSVWLGEPLLHPH